MKGVSKRANGYVSTGIFDPIFSAVNIAGKSMSNGICTGAQITPKDLAQFNGKPLNTNEGTNMKKALESITEDGPIPAKVLTNKTASKPGSITKNTPN